VSLRGQENDGDAFTKREPQRRARGIGCSVKQNASQPAWLQDDGTSRDRLPSQQAASDLKTSGADKVGGLCPARPSMLSDRTVSGRSLRN
jgi:hypothetical protein